MPEAAVMTDVTLGEVYRLIKDQSKTLDTMSYNMDKKPSWDDIERMEEARIERGKLHAAKEQLQDQAIKALEDNNRWLVRTVIASLITGCAGLAFTAFRFFAGG